VWSLRFQRAAIRAGPHQSERAAAVGRRAVSVGNQTETHSTFPRLALKEPRSARQSGAIWAGSLRDKWVGKNADLFALRNFVQKHGQSKAHPRSWPDCPFSKKMQRPPKTKTALKTNTKRRQGRSNLAHLCQSFDCWDIACPLREHAPHGSKLLLPSLDKCRFGNVAINATTAAPR